MGRRRTLEVGRRWGQIATADRLTPEVGRRQGQVAAEGSGSQGEAAPGSGGGMQRLAGCGSRECRPPGGGGKATEANVFAE